MRVYVCMCVRGVSAASKRVWMRREKGEASAPSRNFGNVGEERRLEARVHPQEGGKHYNAGCCCHLRRPARSFSVRPFFSVTLTGTLASHTLARSLHKHASTELLTSAEGLEQNEHGQQPTANRRDSGERHRETQACQHSWDRALGSHGVADPQLAIFH